ncbi:zinc protease [Thiogranum longum]|uniref:Zinc protease n=1 Tax=Thiogranum longum TaxID=1537524 RepID=A0A4R1HCY6_9GAMM|nr:pitrilysin family protein [Thiogranum longum]TCK17099.1 zinc protease [Thiogranum longum]
MQKLLTVALATILTALTSAAQALPDIKSWHTSRGAKVLFVAAPELPMVDVRLVFDAGSSRDGKQPGVAKLTSALLDQGAGGLSADEIARGLEQRGAELGGGSMRDMAWVSLRSLVDPGLLEPSLELFGKVLAKPDFPAEDFARQQKQMLIGLQYEKQKPAAIAKKNFYRKLYGEHPYASHPAGTEDSVKALDVVDLQAFYKHYYVARNATVVIVGSLDESQARKIAARLADSLPEGSKPPPLPPVTEPVKGSEVLIEHPSSQSHVLMGQPGLRRKDPDYFPLYVGNHILGGSGLVSRISEEIREKRGLAYSAYSYFIPMKKKGPYQLGFQTRNDQREEALQVLRDTLSGFIASGPTGKELAAAKSNIVSGFPLRVASNSKISEYLAVIGFYDLPLNYLNTFTAHVEAVTVEQILDAWKRRIHPEKMVTVIVGGRPEAARPSQ